MGKVSSRMHIVGIELMCSLVYPDNLKERLLQYIYSSMFFSDKEISSGVVNWSR
jgi:hypothetical protein